jgi:hypothetical protein
MIINRIYEHQNLLSLELVSVLVGLRTYQHPFTAARLQHATRQDRQSVSSVSPVVLPLFFDLLDFSSLPLLYLFVDVFNHRLFFGARGGVVVKALRYKPAGRGFDSRRFH